MDGDSIIRDTDGRQPRAWPEDETLIPDWIYTDQDTYDRHMREFLGIDDELHASLLGE